MHLAGAPAAAEARRPDVRVGLLAAPLAGLLRPRRLHARRLAGHLGEVRRVRRLAEAFRLVALHPLEQRAQVADGVVDASLDVAELREARAASSAIVKSSVSTSGSSSQVTGADTVASRRARTE